MLDTDNYQIFLIFATETDCENFCHRNRKSATETETDSKNFCHRNRKPKPKPIQKNFATETETDFCHRNRHTETENR